MYEVLLCWGAAVKASGSREEAGGFGESLPVACLPMTPLCSVCDRSFGRCEQASCVVNAWQKQW